MSRRCSLLVYCSLAAPVVAACVPTSETALSGDSTSGANATSSQGSFSAAGTSTGTPAVCGDGSPDADEECDEGDANANDGACLSDCVLARCGDGLVQATLEACDDGNSDNTDTCTEVCEPPACGDGFLQDQETCDDGDDDNNDDCTQLCEAPFCGDGFVQDGEECDQAEANSKAGECSPECTGAVCGDGVMQRGEVCDDGNEDNNDPCTVECAQPACGDGFPQSVNGELCDDGDAFEGDECNSDCTTAGLWTDTFNGPADNNDAMHAVATDSAGNILAVGVTFEAAQSDDIFVRKYAPDGTITWTQTFHGGVTSDVGYGVAVGAGDDVFVVGSTFTLNANRDIWLRRYTQAGATDWTRTFNASGGADEGLGVALDPAGNVVVAGYTTGASRDIWIRKYSPAGAVTWTRTSGGGQDDEGHAVACDGQSNVLVTGYATSGGNGRDVWVRKYDSSGGELWTQTTNGAASETDEGNGIAVDSANNVLVTGFVTTAGQGRDIWLRKYDPDGAELWTQTYNAPQDGTDTGRAVAVDSADNVLVAGSVFRGNQSDNLWLRKYDQGGATVWTSTYNSIGFGSDVGRGVAVDADDAVAFGGYVTRSDIGEFRNLWLRRILQQ